MHFLTATKPRIQKAIYSRNWKDGKPVTRDGISHCFKYLRLESYEDALNNLVVKSDMARDHAVENNPELRSAYLLNYWLDVETQGSPSLLNVQAFADHPLYWAGLRNTTLFASVTVVLQVLFGDAHQMLDRMASLKGY